MPVPAPRTGKLLPVIIVAAVLVAILLIVFTWRGDEGREGGTAEDGLPAAVSPAAGEDAGVPAAGAGPIAETAGEAADAIGAGADPQPEQPDPN